MAFKMDLKKGSKRYNFRWMRPGVKVSLCEHGIIADDNPIYAIHSIPVQLGKTGQYWLKVKDPSGNVLQVLTTDVLRYEE